MKATKLKLIMLALTLLLLVGCGGPKSSYITIAGDLDIGVVADTLADGGKPPSSARDLDLEVRTVLSQRAEDVIRAWVDCDYRNDIETIGTSIVEFLSASKREEYLGEGGLVFARNRIVQNRLAVSTDSVTIQSAVVRGQEAFVQGQMSVRVVESSWTRPSAGPAAGAYDCSFRVVLTQSQGDWFAEYYTSTLWK